ncbi:uncharacterized protein VP01_145g4 [Puccinia sorghi]|uniref:Uncharacterized protein n=1 Tax=Puccinia sorghi TaxID=27349 RepID=A0A0L6VJT7_9BASI|nr:uncharacterized protein VP01_145g4 [Puccinia sorghi]
MKKKVHCLVENKQKIYLGKILQDHIKKYNVLISLQTISNDLHPKLNLSQKEMWKTVLGSKVSHFCSDGVSRTRGWAPLVECTNSVGCAQATHWFTLIPAIHVLLSGLVAGTHQFARKC